MKDVLDTTQNKGRYLYGVVASGETVSLGPLGIEGQEVYTIPCQDLGAIVHNCPTEPYQSKDEERVKSWIRTYQSVLDRAKERFGTVIPLTFDTILRPQDDTLSPDQVVRGWLKSEYARLSTILAQIRGKDEYGVQIYYEPAVVRRWLSEQNEEISKMKEELTAKSAGVAYLYRPKMEKIIKAEMAKLADSWFRDFGNKIKRHCDDIVLEKTKQLTGGKVMVLNLSCLVAGEKIDCLGEELEKINRREGFSVHFSGPWPPYSFVAKSLAQEGENGSHP